MSTDVLRLIGEAAKRRPATASEILTLSSGSSPRSSASRKSSTSRKSPTRATKKKTSGSGKSGSARAKAPCKYGPRGADGYCPKKPKSNNPARQTSGNRTKVTARTGTSATTQAIDVVTNPRASKEQKVQAVEKAVEATATTGLKAAGKKAARSASFQKAKASAVSIAKKVPVGGVLGPVITAAQIVSAPAKKVSKALDRAEAELKLTKQRMARTNQKLTKQQEKTLREQYRSYFLKNPNA